MLYLLFIGQNKQICKLSSFYIIFKYFFNSNITMEIEIKEKPKGKQIKEIQEIEYCLKTPYIDGILQLIELNKDGLTLKEIYKILNKTNTKLEQRTLKKLLNTGLIKKNYSIKEPTLTEKIIIKEKTRPVTEINIIKGELNKRHAFVRSKNPIELLFEKYIQLAEEENNQYAKKLLEELKIDISTRWDNAIKEFDFNTDYISTNIEEATRINETTIKTINENIKNETEPEKKEAGLNIINSLNTAQEIMKNKYIEELNKKQEYRQKLILLFRYTIEKKPKEPYFFHSHINYITLILERIIIEEFITHFTKYYYYTNTKQNPNVNKTKIEIIKALIERLNPEKPISKLYNQNNLFNEITSRLINLENSVRLQISQENWFNIKDPKELQKIEQEIDKNFYKNQKLIKERKEIYE